MSTFEHSAGGRGIASSTSASAPNGSDGQPAGEASATLDLVRGEVVVRWFLDEFASYEGSAAQLQAEGLIPDEFDWPRTSEAKRWTASGLKFELHKQRPEGFKGLKRDWLALDNWSLCIRVQGRDYNWRVQRRIERKKAELAALIREHTESGIAECNAQSNRYWAAVKDQQFQSFKDLIPGLTPPKRARKPRHTSPTQSGTAPTGDAA